MLGSSRGNRRNRRAILREAQRNRGDRPPPDHTALHEFLQRNRPIRQDRSRQQDMPGLLRRTDDDNGKKHFLFNFNLISAVSRSLEYISVSTLSYEPLEYSFRIYND